MAALPVPLEQPNPQLIWDTANAYQRTATLRAAIELDLFTVIGTGATTPDAIAARCNSSIRGIRILCDYLTVIGLLSKRNGAYSLTATAAAFLDRRSPASMGSITAFLNSPKLMAGFSNLTETVRRGTTTLPQQGVNEAELQEWVLFAKSMAPLMHSAAEFIGELATAEEESPKRVLDIAAGHGLFGIAVAARASKAEIIAQDWPNVLQVAEENARTAGISNRYRLLPGDAFHVDFGEGYDLVLLTNLLHHFDRTACVTLLQKVHRCLKAGGRLFMLEFVPNEDGVSPPIAASFSLMMLGVTPAGEAYTLSQHKEMLTAAGFTGNELYQVPQSPQQLIVCVAKQRPLR